MMNFIVSLLVLTAMMLPVPKGWAALSEVDKSGYMQNNLLKNPGAESAKSQWAVSTGSFAVSTTTPIRGSSHFTWDASASTQTFTSTAVAIPAGLYGVNGVASCRIRAASGTATHTLGAYDGTNLLNSATISSVTSGSARNSVNFVFPSSGNISLRLTSATDEPSIAIDDCYLGPADAFNTFQVSQAKFIGSAYIPSTASCSWSRTNTAIGAFGTTAACPGPTVEFNAGPGTIQTTDTDLPRFTVNSLPPGNYEVKVTLEGDAASDYSFTLSDGTTTSGTVSGNGNTQQPSHTLIGYFSYSTSGNKTFEVHGSSGSGAVTMRVNVANQRMLFSIVQYPSVADTVLTPDQQKLPTIQRFTSGSGTYTRPSGVSWIRVRMVGPGGGGGGSSDGAGNGGAGSAGSADTTFSTLTAAKGNGGPGSTSGDSDGGAGGAATVGAGFTTVHSQSGGVGGGNALNSVTAAFFRQTGGIGGGTFFSSGIVPAITNTATGPANTGVGGSGGGMSSTGASRTGAGGGGGAYVEAIANNPSTTYSYAIGSGGAGGSAGTNGVAGSAGTAGVIIVEEYYGATGYPLMVGSVISNSTGVERIERATVANNGATCVVSSQSGSWLTTPCTRGGTGNITMTLAGFSAAPSCSCAAFDTSGVRSCEILGLTASSLNVATVNSAGSTADANVSIICMGPR